MPAFLTADEIALTAVQRALRSWFNSPVPFALLPSSSTKRVTVIKLVSKGARSVMLPGSALQRQGCTVKGGEADTHQAGSGRKAHTTQTSGGKELPSTSKICSQPIAWKASPGKRRSPLHWVLKAKHSAGSGWNSCRNGNKSVRLQLILPLWKISLLNGSLVSLKHV